MFPRMKLGNFLKRNTSQRPGKNKVHGHVWFWTAAVEVSDVVLRVKEKNRTQSSGTERLNHTKCR